MQSLCVIRLWICSNMLQDCTQVLIKQHAVAANVVCVYSFCQFSRMYRANQAPCVSLLVYHITRLSVQVAEASYPASPFVLFAKYAIPGSLRTCYLLTYLHVSEIRSANDHQTHVRMGDVRGFGFGWLGLEFRAGFLCAKLALTSHTSCAHSLRGMACPRTWPTSCSCL